MAVNQTKNIKQKIDEINAIYIEFENKLNELGMSRDKIFKDIAKRIEEKKIKGILNKLKNISE